MKNIKRRGPKLDPWGTPDEAILAGNIAILKNKLRHCMISDLSPNGSNLF